MGIEDVSRTWTRLGREDPLWAVLTDRGKADGRWGVEEFLATGTAEIGTLLARLGALGVAPGRGCAVDFGCGAGRLSHGLAEHGFGTVVGLDISPSMLAKAREIVPSTGCDFRAVVGPGLEAVATGSADLVYSCRVLQHMPPELADGYVREFLRIVRPGGVVAFQLPTRPARTPAGVALALLPAGAARRLRRGMEMHGTPEAQVRTLLAGLGADVRAADPDASAGPRWESRLYVARAAA